VRAVRFRSAIVAATLVVAVFGAACGTDKPEGVASKNIKELPANLLPSTYLGLEPHVEDIKDDLAATEANAYIDSIALFSLRKGDRLEATVQISKLSSKARPKDRAFQERVAGQIGGTTSQRFVMSGVNVYRSAVRKQTLTSWFSGNYFIILSVRDSYTTPRSLLRTLVEEVKL
jgi:hypothetical protein